MRRNLPILGSGRKGLRPSKDRVHRRWVWRAPIPWRLDGDASEAADGSFISVWSGQRSAAGGPANLKLSLWSGFAADDIRVK